MLQLSVLSHLRVLCVVKFLTDIWIILLSDLIVFRNFSLLPVKSAYQRIANLSTLFSSLELPRKVKDAVLACVATSKSHKVVATAHHHYKIQGYGLYLSCFVMYPSNPLLKTEPSQN